MNLRLAQAAQALGVPLVGADGEILRVTTDSRDVRAGDLFIALRGERFDAHDFVAQALAAGAVGAVVAADFSLPNASLIAVPDTRLALGALAAYWRQQFELPVVAITGSNGKTSVKEMLKSIVVAAVGEDAVLATRGNLNNDIGLPLMLLSLRPEHRYAVLEMGMNHVGEIDYLSKLARPTLALINNAQRAHMGHFASVAEIAAAKGEIFNGLVADGLALIAVDEVSAPLWQQLAQGRRQTTFGWSQGDVQVRDVVLSTSGSQFEIVSASAALSIQLPVPGEHMVRNALAATSMALALGIEPEAIVRGLNGFGGVKGRLQLKTAANGARLIDDTYNANPDSVRAAIRVLAAEPSPRVLVFGDIGELGEFSADLHREIGQFAREQGIDRLYTLGAHSAQSAAAFGEGAQHFAAEAFPALLSALQTDLPTPASILVKGSRFMRMECVVEALLS